MSVERRKYEDLPETMEILKQDVLTRNDRGTLVQVALKGQAVDSKLLKDHLDSGLWWYREGDSVVEPMPTLGKSEVTASPDQTPAITGNPVGEISLNEFMKLPDDEKKKIIGDLQKSEDEETTGPKEDENESKTSSGSDEDKTSESKTDEETVTGNPYQNRLNGLKDQYQSRAELEKYAKEIGIDDPTNKTYKNIGLLSEAIVRKENNLPEDFSFDTEE